MRYNMMARVFFYAIWRLLRMETRGWTDVLNSYYDIITTTALALIGGIVRARLSKDRPQTASAYTMALLISFFSSLTTYKILTGFGVESNLASGIGGMAGFLGVDILCALLVLSSKFRKDPIGCAFSWKELFRGTSGHDKGR